MTTPVASFLSPGANTGLETIAKKTAESVAGVVSKMMTNVVTFHVQEVRALRDTITDAGQKMRTEAAPPEPEARAQSDTTADAGPTILTLLEETTKVIGNCIAAEQRTTRMIHKISLF
jgi:hypothetical protein